jgi:glycosyltransferase involved in cell wall biosynthesis
LKIDSATCSTAWGCRMSDAAAPLVCICIPTYNSEKTIRETLLSITEQTYSNFIIEIVDNASTDGTVAVSAALNDARIRIHTHDVNIGAEGNFSRCIQLAKGKYTAIYHADDIYEAQMVEKQVAFLESHPGAGAVFTEARLIDEKNQFIGGIRVPGTLCSPDHLYDFKTIFKAVLQHSNFLICPSVLVRTNVYQEDIKVWRGELFGSGADLDVWLRIAKRHSIGFLREPLMRYRIGQSQWSARVRMSTSRGTLFRIVDHYLEDLSTREMLSSQDWKNYELLDRRDRVGRAVNLFLAGEPENAYRLCHDIFSWDALAAALQTRRGFLVLALGAYLKFLAFSRLNKLGKASLIYMKRMSNT